VTRLVAWVCLLAAWACWPAAAQTTNSGAGLGPSQQPSEPGQQMPAQKNVAPSVEHLLGDLGGVRTNLENQGITLLLDATSEFAANVSCGVKQGATFANQIGFEADIGVGQSCARTSDAGIVCRGWRV
jgi:carbohydrate-selective porin OprB